MEKSFEKMTAEELIEALIQERININRLNIARAKERTAFLGAIAKRPALLSKVTAENSDHLLKFAIEQNPALFVHLKREQYTDLLAQTFLYMRLKENTPQSKKNADLSPLFKSILVQKSFDDKIVFIYSHATQEGEELYYLDKELQVPVSIKSSFKATLKLTDAVSLIEKLDTHITQLGELKIKGVIADIINNQFKAYLNEYIEKNNAGYYTLCTSFAEIEEGFATVTKKTLASYGIAVTDFIIKQFAIPKDIQDKIENLSFEIRQRRADVQADAEFAKISLENYEAKLAVNAKYPDVEPTLTEYEKDLALKRYLTKIGRNETQQVDHSINLQHKLAHADSTIVKPEDIIPDIAPKTNKFKKAFITLAIIAGVASTIALIAKLPVGMIMHGCFCLIFGLIGSLNPEKFQDEQVEPTADATVEATPTNTNNTGDTNNG